MKFFKTLLMSGLLIFSAQMAFSQTRLDGKVVEIINGKTIVIETAGNSNRLIAELEYIEIPEPEQQLAQTVKEHLQKLLLGKDVEFIAKSLMEKKLVGKVYLNNVDMSQQLLRDGAAWYAVLEKNRQDAAESENYQLTEAQAKLEKRGIWGVENLKPAWEFRAEKERAEKEKIEAQAKIVKVEETPKPKKKPTVIPKKFPNWLETQKYETTNNISGLMIGFNSKDKSGFVATPQYKIDLTDKENTQKVEIAVAYFYKESDKKAGENYYLIGVESESGSWKFLKTNDLVVFADNEKINIGKAVRVAVEENGAFKETLTYKIKRTIVEKVANAQKVEFKISTYAGKLDNDLQNIVRSMLNAGQ
jgi:endonuclease YncB( thermonuclease family)